MEEIDWDSASPMERLLDAEDKLRAAYEVSYAGDDVKALDLALTAGLLATAALRELLDPPSA